MPSLREPLAAVLACLLIFTPFTPGFAQSNPEGIEVHDPYARAIEELAARETGFPDPSHILAVLRTEMTADPQHWQGYLAPGDDLLAGLSDRVRYYWPRPAITAALARLGTNLGQEVMAAAVGHHVGDVAAKYRAAAGLAAR